MVQALDHNELGWIAAVLVSAAAHRARGRHRFVLVGADAPAAAAARRLKIAGQAR
ncbi:MAG: hypothetical protein IPI87_02010 [Betaproteobacteria bacterium]|nr:hypothetical protein [Betaproteobacteria bacterium]